MISYKTATQYPKECIYVVTVLAFYIVDSSKRWQWRIVNVGVVLLLTRALVSAVNMMKYMWMNV